MFKFCQKNRHFFCSFLPIMQIYTIAFKFSHRNSDLLKHCFCSYSHSSSPSFFYCCCGVLLFIADRQNCIGRFNVTGSFVQFPFNYNQQIKKKQNQQKKTNTISFHYSFLTIYHSYTLSDYNNLWNVVNRLSYGI